MGVRIGAVRAIHGTRVIPVVHATAEPAVIPAVPAAARRVAARIGVVVVVSGTHAILAADVTAGETAIRVGTPVAFPAGPPE